MATKTVPRGKRGGPLIRTTDDLLTYWGERITAVAPESEYLERSSIIMRGDTVFHYGSHFPLATIFRRPNGRARLVLLNGDRWAGPSGFGSGTAQRQFQVQGIVARETAGTNVQSVILPFSALNAAGIVPESIKLLEVREDRWVRSERIVDTVPDNWSRDEDGRAYTYRQDGDYGRDYVVQREDGKFILPQWRHWLADSLFSAKVRDYDRESREPVERTAKFLSSFDYNEPHSPYFLCELPRTSAKTVDEAIEALKPEAVKAALAAGLDVLRQGDVFAIPTSLTTKELKSRATPYTFAFWGDGPVQSYDSTLIRSRSKHGVGADILNTNHRATHVVVTKDGDYYGRGMLYHDPSGWGREPDHRRVKLGDGKTWYRLVKNTVPADRTGLSHGRSRAFNLNQSGSNRAWTLGGNVD